MHNPRLRLALGLSLMCSACTTTTYRLGKDKDADLEVRLDGRRVGETFVRKVSHDVRHHYFLFGLIPYERELNVAEEVRLKDGQALVNLRIENKLDGVDCLILAGGAAVSSGLLPVLWTTRTTVIQGDVVTMPPLEDSATQAAAPGATQGEAPPPPRPAGPLKWQELEQELTHQDAAAACKKAGARLPTRAELKAHKKSLDTDGDVWTSESAADEAWSFNVASGAAFLKDPATELGVACVGESAPP